MDSHFLQLLELARGGTGFEKGACHARSTVRVVAVGADDARMRASLVFAGRGVLVVEGGEVGAGALIAHRGPGLAGVGSVSPLETR